MIISIISIASLTVYHMVGAASYSIVGYQNTVMYHIMLFPLTAGILNLLIISFLDFVYDFIAVKLTNFEYCRTNAEYEQSLTIKKAIFEFVNYYSPLIYIAFLKGKFIGYPAKYNRLWGFRLEECPAYGCLLELSLHLVIIMIGKQAISAIYEMFFPYICKRFRKFIKGRRMRQGIYDPKLLVACNQWTEDYHLIPCCYNSMFREYLEMGKEFYKTIIIVSTSL